jgi:hypothetical protein
VGIQRWITFEFVYHGIHYLLLLHRLAILRLRFFVVSHGDWWREERRQEFGFHINTLI